ncbi:TonB-dependent receptor [Cellulophaga tyrosinoxydans]|uniref:Outer membrane receptor proteins, mostly Fe transport n=1 Tax=Cellulophaga tyrosinoxydans TaxID=504486 RepID=A0A1W1Z4U8_9FLAO|nr:TonB-dependent receptor [Cellulophaga tyrosinoxydans]SMC43459.1 Outer membrane receptor proteins, mostly Fe transport [Cellulophaga tyrosinoxydans]
MKTILYLVTFCMFGIFGYSQTTVKGSVVDQDNQPIPGANVVITGKSVGTVTDFDGNFILETSEVPPFSLKITSIGYSESVKNITANNQNIAVVLNETQTLLDEIVISASRTPERIFESPVTVERFGIEAIKNTTAADFYGGLENLKGVDVNTNSLTFKSVNTRGFASFANTRFMQLVDGMDNSTPALNFPIGNLVGMVETDVKSVELLPGASSALYGANAFNGILFMTSKSPFDYEGISVSIKRGITSQESAGDNSYTDFGIRAAHKFSDKFAGKVNFGYLKGTDWAATSEVDKIDPTRTRADYDYDGINVYGDEVSTNIRAASGLGIIPDVEVSRTGYNERVLTNYNAESIKADWGLYYRPIEDNSLELSYVGKVGTGNTIYQGTNRYNIKGFFQEQHKLEIKNDNFFLRGYVVADKAGNSYDMVFTGININRAWKSDEQWFQEYIGTYAGIELSGNPLGLTDQQKHDQARAVADTGRYLPGTPEFEAAFNKSINDPNLATGSKFQDASKYYHSDANYNFSHLIDFAEIQVGGSYRRYSLNSGGTIYTDFDGPIDYSEYGVYTQIQKKIDLANEKSIKLTGSVRYDKSEFFDGFFSPRISAGYTLNRDHNIRASVQTGFRNPTTQDLFIGLDAGRAILVGSAPDNLDRYSTPYDVSLAGRNAGQPNTIEQSGRAAYENAYSAQSVETFKITNNVADLKVSNPDLVKPEQVTSAEIGYRGKINKLVVDFSAYYNSYKDFISQEVVDAPYYGVAGDGSLSVDAIRNDDVQRYSTYTNSSADINSYGASIGLDMKVLGNFDLGGSYTFTKLDFDRDANPDVMLNFNTPEHKFKANFGNEELFKNFGFNLSYRFSDDYFWEATFGEGVVPEFHVLDAQVSYAVPSIKSLFKLGGTNITGQEYFTAFGTGFIGSMYYLSWTINN